MYTLHSVYRNLFEFLRNWLILYLKEILFIGHREVSLVVHFEREKGKIVSTFVQETTDARFLVVESARTVDQKTIL